MKIDFQVWHENRLVEDNQGDEREYIMRAFSDYLDSLEDKPGDGFTFMVNVS